MDPCCANQNPSLNPPKRILFNSSTHKIPAPKETKNQMDSKINRYFNKISGGFAQINDFGVNKEMNLRFENSKIKIVHGPLGKAIIATDNLTPGEVILKAWGKPTKVRTMHTIQISPDGHIVPDHPLGWFNHSCEPNCGLLIKADEQIAEAHVLRHVAANEELTFDYATFEYEIHHMPEECLCNAEKCRGSISGYKDMPEELREMYGDYIASYLKVFQAEVAR